MGVTFREGSPIQIRQFGVRATRCSFVLIFMGGAAVCTKTVHKKTSQSYGRA